MNDLPGKKNEPQETGSLPLIFAMDDEPMLLELATMILQPQGFRLETFRDPLLAARTFSLANPRPSW